MGKHVFGRSKCSILFRQISALNPIVFGKHFASNGSAIETNVPLLNPKRFYVIATV